MPVLRGIDEALPTDDGSPELRNVRLSVRLAIADSLAQLGPEDEATTRFVDIIRAARPRNLLGAVAPIDAAQVRALVAPQPLWHSVDPTSRFVEGEGKTSRVLAREIVSGKNALDLASLGRRGQMRIVAHAWK